MTGINISSIKSLGLSRKKINWKKLTDTRIDLSRRATVIARGVAILLIMFHNLVHIFPTIVNECEFNFNPFLNKGFFNRLNLSNPLLTYDLLSFLGWYGVPVFIFLSGFGLSRRYASDPFFNRRSFLIDNWRKLFILMLPAVLLFLAEWLGYSLTTGEFNCDTLIRKATPLTELNGLLEWWWPVIPGVYWYLGLAFELYVIYAVIVHRRPLWIIWVLTAVCYITISILVTPGLLNKAYHIVEYLRHNFTGWLLPFVIGLSMGRKKDFKALYLSVAFVLSILLFLPLVNSPFGWQAAAVAAVAVIVTISAIIDRIPLLSTVFEWFGKLSAFIYVAHPIVRHVFGKLFFDFTSQEAVPTYGLCSLYFITVIISALIYQPICGFISRKILRH